jgi:hypothetical protein
MADRVHLVCNNWLPFGAPFELGPEIYGIYWTEERAIERLGEIAANLNIAFDGGTYLDAKGKSHEQNYYYIESREVEL